MMLHLTLEDNLTKIERKVSLTEGYDADRIGFIVADMIDSLNKVKEMEHEQD